MANIKKKKEVQVSFQFKGIELLESSIEIYPKDIPLLLKHTFDIAIESNVSVENKFILEIVSIRILTEDKLTILGSLKASNIFYIENFEDVIKKNNQGQYYIPEELTLTLNHISLSTTRGIMWHHFKGTYLHNAVLPIIDPKIFEKTKKRL